MPYPVQVNCPQCGPNQEMVRVVPETIGSELYRQACAGCLTRFTLDGVTFDYLRKLPPPTLRLPEPQRS